MNRKETIQKLIAAAKEAQQGAYVPYSGYAVGAALLADDGKMYTGCNIENASYTPTVCAERVAVFKAISEGAKRVKIIAVVAGDDMGYPCGVCRQVLREFGEDATIVVAKDEENYHVHTLDELLPHSFGPENVKGDVDA
ncbi:cytidine deaminase [Aedoeadaptatus urinae]|uniref:cytidine deaminase n=1 Tax=Aedoeadaptatus urinae TaxID=1871017 RepID=UPI00097DD0B5|nr:cytidine deaminase [Peptoniphilus urinae]